LTETFIASELSLNERVENGFRMIEKGTSDCDKADIELITPPSFEFGIIISYVSSNFPSLTPCSY
jgi:hypothetical protein